MVYGKGSSKLLQEAPTIPPLFKTMTAPLNVGYLDTIRSIAALAAISGGCPLRIYETKIVTRYEQLSKHRKFFSNHPKILILANKCLIHFRVIFVSLTNVNKNNDNAVYFRCYRILNIDKMEMLSCQ